MPPHVQFAATKPSLSRMDDTARQKAEKPVSSPLCTDHQIENACEHIFRAWCKVVTPAEARAQADEFRRRCKTLTKTFVLSDAELEAVLDAVAGAMAAQ
jgi:hypothetical protein